MEAIAIEGQRYELVCRRRSNASAIYRGDASYLRLGPPSDLYHELAIHRVLAAQGFPVAELLHEGEAAGQSYYLETDLGERVFGERFEDEVQQQGCITEATFQAYLAVVYRWALAQLQNASASDYRPDFAHFVRLSEVKMMLPDLAVDSEQAFIRAMSRLRDFPAVWTHGDFHPYNVCQGGVIDLETVVVGVAGYDVITGLLAQDLYPPDPTSFRFTRGQVQHYLRAMDDLYGQFHLPPPSVYVDDYRICKMMVNIWLTGNRPPAEQRWFYRRYREMIQGYR